MNWRPTRKVFVVFCDHDTLCAVMPWGGTQLPEDILDAYAQERSIDRSKLCFEITDWFDMPPGASQPAEKKEGR